MKFRTELVGFSASLLPLFVMTPLLAAQTDVSPASTAGTAAITAEEIRRHVDALTNDSIGPRTFGSPGLERAAQYVAAQFEQLNLKPAGSTQKAFHDVAFNRAQSDTNSWFQRYRLPGNLTPVFGQTAIHFRTRLQRNAQDVIELSDRLGRDRQTKTVERTVSVPFENGAYFAVDTIPESVMGKWNWGTPTPMTILTGRHTAETASAATAKLDGEVVLYAPPIGIDSVARQEVIDALYADRNVVVLSEKDSVTFARRNAISLANPPKVTNNFMAPVTYPNRWATSVWSGHVAGVFAAAGLNLRQLQTDSTPAVRKVPSMAAWITTRFQDARQDTISGVNVIGMLLGTDSTLRREFVVFTAHMDQVEGKGEGADDNASGVAALLTLAKAFSQPGARPKRSLVFAITSGTAHQWAGANYFAGTESIGYGVPTLLNITLERLGRASKDSLFVDGTSDLTFTMPPSWVAGRHPELGLTLVEGGTAMTKKSEHMAFTWRAVPSLFFYGSANERAGDAADTAEAIDLDQATRMLRLIHHSASEIANGPEWPRWSSEGRMRRILLLGK